MKRQTIYKGVTIQTEIIFNYQSERGLNGKKWHKIAVNTITDKVSENFGKFIQVISTISNEHLLAKCEDLEQEAKNFLDKTEKVSDVEQFFINNGFVKNSFGK